MNKLFLSIYLPTIFVDVFLNKSVKACNSQISPQSKPQQSNPVSVIATIDSTGGKYIARCSRDLIMAGLLPGTKLTQGLATFPEAQVCEFSEHLEQRYLEELAMRSYRYSPICGVDEPVSSQSSFLNHRFVGINLDISGSERLFGGYDKFLNHIDEQIAALGLFARLSISSSLGAAWTFSRYLPRRCSLIRHKEVKTELVKLPLAALRLELKTQQSLASVNVRYIGDLLTIPRRSLVARFGGEVIKRIDQALGIQEEPIATITIKRKAEYKHLFPQPITDSEIIKQNAALLLAQIKQLLAERGRVLSRFLLVIERDGAIAIEELFNIHFPSTQADHTLNHTQQRLWLYLEKIDYARGIISLKITVLSSEPEHAQNLSYLPTAQNNRTHILDLEKEGQLIDTISDRLGPDKLLQVHHRESFIPEHSFSLAPVTGNRLEPSTPNTQALKKVKPAFIPSHRPSVLFSPPEQIRAMAVMPDSIPFQITWRKHIYRILHGFGPERISSEWWLVEECKSTSRDYFKVQINSGMWLWIFRELENSTWYIHGVWQ